MKFTISAAACLFAMSSATPMDQVDYLVEELIHTMHYWSPTTIYAGDDCIHKSTVIESRLPEAWGEYPEDNLNTWRQWLVNDRGMDKNTKTVMVPPGMKLEMWDSDARLDRGDSPQYTVHGKMRDDRQGVLCQDLADFSKQASVFRLSRE